MSDAQFRPVRPFDIDDGELEGLRPEECFVLGYECAMIDNRIKSSEDGFDVPIHAANRARIAAQLDREERKYRFDWMQDDVSESWMLLTVYPQ